MTFLKYTELFFLRQINDPEMMDRTVSSALQSGYRLIDTAFNYGNEEAIGASLRKWFKNGGKREDLFIVTKVNKKKWFILLTIFLAFYLTE